MGAVSGRLNSQDIARPSKETVACLRRTPTSSLSDALDQLGVTGFMSYEIKPMSACKRIVGPAITIKDAISNTPEPPLLALEAIDLAKEGDIIVRAVDHDSKNIGLWGGLMATAAKRKGVQGAIVDGGIRDIDEIAELRFQIFARSVVPSTSLRRTRVEAINVPVICGGVRVRPGDLVVGDSDGVVVVPLEHVEEVTKRATEIDEIEKLEAQELRRGAKFVDTVKKFSRL